MEDFSSPIEKELQELHQQGVAEKDAIERHKLPVDRTFFRVSPQQVGEIKRILLSPNVKERLLALEEGRRKQLFESWNFTAAVAQLLKEDPKGLKEALLKLFESEKLVKDFFGDIKGPQKAAISFVYNHRIGPEIMAELVKPNGQFVQKVSVLRQLVGAITKPLDPATEYKLWSLFRLPENPKQLNQKEMETLQKVRAYLLEKKGKDVWDVNHLVSIIRSQEGRELFAEVLKKGHVDALKHLLVKYVGAVEKAMETPEGINTVGYLFTLPEGKQLVFQLLKHPVVVWRLLRKQMAYNKEASVNVGEVALERFLNETR
ncbi:MAG: hypothetical protein GXN92_00555 [Candidatus Micrarchaeota archaeon]|nr:hypothetical protein [Candidatus Micrarchaeota archaeon]